MENKDKEAIMLSCLIDSGKGHLFSLHDRKIIFRAMESFSASQNSELRNKYVLDIASLQGGISLALDELKKTDNKNLCNLLEGLLKIKPSH